jgi:hypothetical protein
VAEGPVFVWSMIEANIHQCQGMVGILDRAVVVLQTQPRDPAMVILHELAVGLEALLLVHDKVRSSFLEIEHLVEKSWESINGLSVWSTLGLHLENSKVDSHLDDVSPVDSFDKPNRWGVRIKLPIAKNFVESFG